jgi:GNAT superfamily N-acetyltransferase
MGDVVIRPARGSDLPALEQALGQRDYFADRLARQRRALGVLFTARRAGVVVGSGYLWLEPAEESEIRRFLPDVPLLTHLEVLPRHRNLGVGSQLIAAAEQVAQRRDHRLVALAVEESNPDAARLYQRLGYTDWGHGLIECLTEPVGPAGLRLPEKCAVLVKDLTAARVAVLAASTRRTP